MACRVEVWRWNAGLSAPEVREQVLVGLLARSNGRAAGPHCSLLAEVRRFDRRALADRRLADGDWQLLEERRDRGERRRDGAGAA